MIFPRFRTNILCRVIDADAEVLTPVECEYLELTVACSREREHPARVVPARRGVVARLAVTGQQLAELARYFLPINERNADPAVMPRR